jgi:hypothetical protein
MESDLVVVTDLGLFKAYLMNRKGRSQKPSIQFLESFETELHQKFAENLTDTAGRFVGNPAMKSARGYGEPHDLDLERKKRTIKQIGDEISRLVHQFEVKRWFFAGSKEIYKPLLARLTDEVKRTLSVSLDRNLTKFSKADLMLAFNGAAAPG